MATATAMAATDAPLQSRSVDDKSPICVPFILSRVEAYRKEHPNSVRPFIIGLNGVQGVGKTTLVRALADALQGREGLQTLVVSIDDFYLTHADQLALAAAHPDNALVQYRGEPVVILEGWLTGFRPLAPSAVEAKWRSPTSRTLHNHTLAHLLFINEQLARYDPVTDLFDAFIHIDAEDLSFVYDWRRQQEAQLRRERGEENAMSDDEVVRFVDAYYPAYELYVDGLREEGVFRPVGSRKGCSLRLVVDQVRSVVDRVVV
ncbi:P-loop containing nucleoside triphosphate hydrolase protein [Bombardia bombarda]|uniref:P-loop containing nucleoside triphosphate hydrolase protein n=1 Tax=Bombardia bombarda TaxID=252184 RepID=A0AA40CH86_9PEZI|nr:P-loop containing nucleoside triphosphate hydrolase protein [Bombardia bombarda]